MPDLRSGRKQRWCAGSDLYVRMTGVVEPSHFRRIGDRSRHPNRDADNCEQSARLKIRSDRLGRNAT
jgi:hypothetical protein